jgi:CRISPR/Cas system CMR subunit Cmr6 (Cas7 group RAMP superfamily)
MRPERLYLEDMLEAAGNIAFHIAFHIADRSRERFLGDLTVTPHYSSARASSASASSSTSSRS